MAAKKKGASQSLADKLRKAFGDSVSSVELGTSAQVSEYISTGIDVIDHYVLGHGGWPVGRISEVFGEEQTGKTALAMHSLAAVQRAKGVGVLADWEYSFDEERAAAFGVNLDDLIILNPSSTEETFEMVKATLKGHDAKSPILIVWDSVAAASTKKQLEAEAGNEGIGSTARLMSAELKKLPSLLKKKRGHLMMLNQTRQKIGVMYGDPTTTPGGKALQFHASVRVRMYSGQSIKDSDNQHVGKLITITCVKHRQSPPWRKARTRFLYKTGWDNAWSTLEHAKEAKLLPQASKGPKATQLAYDKLGWPARKAEAAQGDSLEISLDDDTPTDE